MSDTQFLAALLAEPAPAPFIERVPLAHPGMGEMIVSLLIGIVTWLLVSVLLPALGRMIQRRRPDLRAYVANKSKTIKRTITDIADPVKVYKLPFGGDYRCRNCRGTLAACLTTACDGRVKNRPCPPPLDLSSLKIPAYPDWNTAYRETGKAVTALIALGFADWQAERFALTIGNGIYKRAIWVRQTVKALDKRTLGRLLFLTMVRKETYGTTP